MTLTRRFVLPLLALAFLAGGCANRPINPPITKADETAGYRFFNRPRRVDDNGTLVVLAFSGGGTRAAAFSYGVLEFLRDTEIVGPKGRKTRLLDHVGVVTGVSGGSFTALSYGLYGDKLFDDYERRFLKRDVQGEIVSRFFSPTYWPALWSDNWGRSELAADLYDEILFNGATFDDLNRGKGPFVIASATDISTGARFPFTQGAFDAICSDLTKVRLSRAAAASSAVPVVLTPVTLNNYGGSCGYTPPNWMSMFIDSEEPPRPAARATRHMKEENEFSSPDRPYLHLVDGGISDNLGMRAVLDAVEVMEALHLAGKPSPFDNARNLIVFIVNSVSVPKTDWDRSEEGPGTIEVLLKSAGVPIDNYSYEATELLKDKRARWDAMREVRNSAAFAANKDPAVTAALRTPDTRIYAIDVSFSDLNDPAERAYLNELPTSFVLPEEAVDRLRAAAGKIILASPEFKKLLKAAGASIVVPPVKAVPAKP